MYVVFQVFAIGFPDHRVFVICVSSILFLFGNGQADFWQAYFHATGTIASAVFCGIGDEQNVNCMQVFGRQIRLIFKLLQVDLPDYARLSDMCCHFSIIILTLPRRYFGKQILLQHEGSQISAVA